jgi:hypothetical protein
MPAVVVEELKKITLAGQQLAKKHEEVSEGVGQAPAMDTQTVKKLSTNCHTNIVGKAKSRGLDSIKSLLVPKLMQTALIRQKSTHRKSSFNAWPSANSANSANGANGTNTASVITLCVIWR